MVRRCHAVRNCPDKVTAPLPGPAAPVEPVEPAGQRALPEAAGGSGSGILVVVGGLKTEQQAEVAETDTAVHLIVLKSGIFQTVFQIQTYGKD